ncbi:OmpA family protein [Manganibacter manganicus]|uniref:Flagellar motor protein MotB n=1 Tax=Manganibacter manganicus TaxID=1873176 RepID=A0A1V8RTN8_9HYPH|nr:OmpA family protein [Pseudaminobacter manganicus]OQM76535.1 flagellar motor protein MotB [Pseudaminobacter manganicus]
MRFVLAIFICLFGIGVANATDVAGSADHPLIPRYEGSEIVSYDAQEFTDYRLMVAKAAVYGGLDKNLDATLPLEGKVTRLSYRAPADRSVLEVFRNYENALKAVGFEMVFTCEKDACGGRNFNHTIAAGKLYSLYGEYQAEQRYLAAKLSRPEGDVYATVYAVMNKSGGGPNANRTMVQLDVVELKPMEEKMAVLDAGALQSEIATEGRVAVYGILFDFDKADIRPDSKPQLQEIAALLKDSPDLKVLIVGHTDAKGALDYNRDLSLRRAKSVVATLTSVYRIDTGRLTAVGVGMAAPVATNRTEEGRAKNRRVEIVEW